MTRSQMRELRQSLGLTQRELAQLLRLAPNTGADTVRKYESGVIRPSGPVVLLYELLQKRGIAAFR